MSKTLETFKPGLMLLMVAAAAALILGLVNLGTAGRIAAIAEETMNNAMQAVLPAVSYTDTGYEDDGEVNAIYASSDGGWVVQVTESGSQGLITMMVGVSAATGLTFAGVISNALVSISPPVSFPVWTFISAGIVNFFVPSGGSQWAVQGPIIMPAGLRMGVTPEISACAIAWGDAWTNMAQPFWALPALGVAKLSARDIMGYCVIDLLVTGIIIIIGFLVVGWTGVSALSAADAAAALASLAG